MHFWHKFITCLFHSFLCTQWNCTENKTFNNGILLKGVLIRKLLSNHLVSCSFTNLDYLNPESAHFDRIINLPFFVLKIFGLKFLVFCKYLYSTGFIVCIIPFFACFSSYKFTTKFFSRASCLLFSKIGSLYYFFHQFLRLKNIL